MNAIFIAGTDTGAGKTVICGCLAHYMSRRGYSVITQKWVQTGSRGARRDISAHLELQGKSRAEVNDYIPYMSPYSFGFPSSPHLAARKERRTVEVNRIKKSVKFLSGRFDFVLAEGTGGLMVPLNNGCLFIDLVKELKMPVILVAGNRLGAINHTLLAIEALRARKIGVLGLIFNNIDKKTDSLILKDNPEIVRNISGIKLLGIMPAAGTPGIMRNKFFPIGGNILKEYQGYERSGKKRP